MNTNRNARKAVMKHCRVQSNYTTATAPFCHFRSYDGGTTRVSRKLQDVDTSAVEYRKNLKPSEIVHVFDQDQLGIDDLSDALTLMNETFTILNTTSCNTNHQPDNLLLCVYHRQSIPRKTTKSGQYGSIVPIKGWQYRTLDRCFIPYENMEYSTTCGRSSYQFNTWSQYMLEHQEPIQKATSLSKCDRLPLSLGRNIWDYDADEYALVPPLPTTEPPLEGVKYSEKSICGPRILIVGAVKCGTNTIGTMLSHHPRVKLNRCTEEKPKCDLDHFIAGKESVWEGHGLTHTFVEDRHNYIAKYAQKLPVTEEYEYNLPNGTAVVGSGSLTMDKSPSYLNTDIFPNIASRAKQLLPNAKIVILLCNPVERMYSEFHHTLLYSKDIFDLFFTSHNAPVPRNFTEMVQYMKFSAEICNSNPIFV
jgi:Sulfotransferase family